MTQCGPSPEPATDAPLNVRSCRCQYTTSSRMGGVADVVRLLSGTMTDRTSAEPVGVGRTLLGAERLVWASVYAGLVLALVGVIAGSGVAGQDSNLGTAIVVFSLMLGILIVLAGISATAAIRGRSTP
jgi:hypothetical protein